MAQSKEKWHTRCLTARQLTILKKLGSLISDRFYLAGGTAIALHLGHRMSLDLDWFCSTPIENPELFAKQLQDAGLNLAITSVSTNTLHSEISGVRVSFLSYQYQDLNPPISANSINCRIASLQDLGCLKLSALTHRGAKKDFIDIFALNRRAFALSEMLELYRKKYGINNVAHVFYALSFFDDADKEKTPKMLWRTDWRKIKTELQAEIKKVSQRFDCDAELPG